MIKVYLKFRKSIKYNLKKYIFFLFLFISIIISANVFAGGDLLEKAFDPSMQQQGLVDLGITKDQVGNEILRESMTINLGGGSLIQYRAPLIVRIAKLLLRLTIVLAVTMVLYNGVLYIIQSSKGEYPKEPQKNLLNIGIGILLALSSLGIINLINSITISSLKTSDDMGGLSIGCQTGGTIVAGDNLKEWICLHSLFGHPQNTMSGREWKYLAPFSHSSNTMEDPALGGNRCWICDNINSGCKRKKIYDSEMEDKCVEDMGGNVVK